MCDTPHTPFDGAVVRRSVAHVVDVSAFFFFFVCRFPTVDFTLREDFECDDVNVTFVLTCFFYQKNFFDIFQINVF